jgi:HPt (histidine-containing phosphotransfer) domain-containing protein
VEEFEELCRGYRASLPEKREALEAEWNGLLAGGTAEPHAKALRRQLHQLAGSGGAYGFDAMGEMARELEKCWVRWLNTTPAERVDPLALCADIAPLMRLLCDTMRGASLPAESSR